MDELIRDHPTKVLTIIGIVITVVLWVLYQLGWSRPKKTLPWDGVERRSDKCADHPQMQHKVCSLYEKLDDLDSKTDEAVHKIDDVVKKTEFILGLIEARWGKLRINREE